jgi:hypothetical protein
VDSVQVRNVPAYSGIKPRSHDYPTCGLVTKLTELHQLPTQLYITVIPEISLGHVRLAVHTAVTMKSLILCGVW